MFRRSRSLPILIALAVLAGACGSGGGSADSTPDTVETTEVEVSTATEAPKDEPLLQDLRDQHVEPGCDRLNLGTDGWQPATSDISDAATRTITSDHTVLEGVSASMIEHVDDCSLAPPGERLDGATGLFENAIECRAESEKSHGAWILPEIIVENADGDGLDVVPVEVSEEPTFKEFLDAVFNMNGGRDVIGLNYVLHPGMSYGFGPGAPASDPTTVLPTGSGGLGEDWTIDVVDTGLPWVVSDEGTGWTQNLEGHGASEFRPAGGATSDPTYGHGVAAASAASLAAPGATVRVASARSSLTNSLGGLMSVGGLGRALDGLRENESATTQRILNLSLGTYACESPYDEDDDLVQANGAITSDNGTIATLGALSAVLGFDAAEGAAPATECTPLPVGDDPYYDCVLAAAGNNGSDQPFFPADFESIVGVGSHDSGGKKSDFSNSADLYALGNGLALAYPLDVELEVKLTEDSTESRTLSGAATWSGTSFASPSAIRCILEAHEAGGTPLELQSTAMCKLALWP